MSIHCHQELQTWIFLFSRDRSPARDSGSLSVVWVCVSTLDTDATFLFAGLTSSKPEHESQRQTDTGHWQGWLHRLTQTALPSAALTHKTRIKYKHRQPSFFLLTGLLRQQVTNEGTIMALFLPSTPGKYVNVTKYVD